ncbi:MAG: helicase-related protein [Pseudomonadota bacterium]
MQARKILGSSVAAIEQFLTNVIARLERQLPADLSSVTDDENAEDIQAEAREAQDDGEFDDDGSAVEIDLEKLNAEISELTAYRDLARQIGKNAKGEKLIERLPEVLGHVVSLDGKRKAVIFTESVRTQNYLARLLSENGYEGQIVLMNGSNNDPESRRIYQAWLAKHKDTGSISGSKTADMKQAIVDAFRSDDKTILIATESGAEGINLQFCSLLINFDLPWNPQRVEQRIGRCHRYGQKIDVTVVNMLNRKNRAEERVYELLSEKFHLFQGVFGASDDVLGTIESGFDFEKKVVEAVQRCRSAEEVEKAFAEIEAELDESIRADMAETRRKLFDVMDATVVSRLKMRDESVKATLGKFEHRLLTIARAELPAAIFHEGSRQRLDYDGKTYTTEWPLADEMGWVFFRIGDDTLARDVVERAKVRDLAPATLTFDYKAYRDGGNARLSDVEQLQGKCGWLKVALLKAETAEPDATRERLLVAALCDDGATLDADLIDRLMLVPAAANSELSVSVPSDMLNPLLGEAQRREMEKAQAENMAWLDEETDKLDSVAEDLEKALDLRLKEMKREIDAAKRAFRTDKTMTLEQKVSEQRRIKKLEDERRQLKLRMDAEIQRISDEKDEKLDRIAQALEITPTVTPVLTIRWEMTA